MQERPRGQAVCPGATKFQAMAVRTTSNNLDAVISDLTNGGYTIQAVEKIRDLRGRSVDVFLDNGVVVKWDEFSQVIWAEGVYNQCRKIEFYFSNLYDRPWLPRELAVFVSRWIIGQQQWGRIARERMVREGRKWLGEMVRQAKRIRSSPWVARMKARLSNSLNALGHTKTLIPATNFVSGVITSCMSSGMMQRMGTFSLATNFAFRFKSDCPAPVSHATYPTPVAFEDETALIRRSMVKKLLHTRMRVNNLERTVKFYEDALGLKVARRHTSPRGAQLAFLATPNSDEEIEICQLPNSPSVEVQPDLMHLAFEVENIAIFTSVLEKKGYKLSDGPTQTGSGSIIAFIDAPEGYEVELIQKAK